MEKWEEIICDSTNEQYALNMIIKVREYRAKYKGLDVESIATEFSTLSSIRQKQEWSNPYIDNMQSITKTCRIHRRIQRECLWEKYDRERKAAIAAE